MKEAAIWISRADRTCFVFFNRPDTLSTVGYPLRGGVTTMARGIPPVSLELTLMTMSSTLPIGPDSSHTVSTSSSSGPVSESSV